MRIRALGVIAVLLLAGCAATPEPFTVNGSVSVPLDYQAIWDTGEQAAVGDPCAGGAGYDDISEDAQVIVTDAQGDIVARGSLGRGILKAGESDSLFEATCVFKFRVPEIPAGESFYTVEVGRESRGGVVYTEDEMIEGVELSLG